MITETNTPFFVTSTTDPNRPTSTPSPPLPSFTPTYQVWLATARAINAVANTATQQFRDQMTTQIAQFPPACENTHSNMDDISPDGKWMASSCGYNRDQGLVVQNREGTKWVLAYKDFLNPDIVQSGEVPIGTLYPRFWSPDGVYLYFITAIGYSGGGDQCFTRAVGDYGLFRLDLKNGTWMTLIPPIDIPFGFGVSFSSTGRRYAANMNLNGIIMITDLKTGEVSRINLDGTIEDVMWSPDGTQLAFTVASCDAKQGTVQSSSVYVWDALKNEKRILFTTNEMVLRPEVWLDNSTFRVIGEKFADGNTVYTIYVFDVVQNTVTFTGTATPHPY